MNIPIAVRNNTPKHTAIYEHTRKSRLTSPCPEIITGKTIETIIGSIKTKTAEIYLESTIE